jgi:hypothetical protein
LQTKRFNQAKALIYNYPDHLCLCKTGIVAGVEICNYRYREEKYGSGYSRRVSVMIWGFFIGPSLVAAAVRVIVGPLTFTV